jgi:Arc/MetJ family transcription regulator
MPDPIDADTHAGVRGVIGRTDIEIDGNPVTEAMRRYGLPSKRAAVDRALRRLVGESMTREEALAMEGAGWEGDRDEMRRNRQVAAG